MNILLLQDLVLDSVLQQEIVVQTY